MTRLIFILIISLTSTICSQAQTIQYIGAPTTTVISRGNFRTDSIFYLPKRSKAPTDTAAFRYQISDSSLYVWTGSQWIKAGGSGTISGTGITGYVPQFSGTTTIDTSGLFTLGSRLGIGSSTFAYTSTNTANVELNGTAGGILGFKRNDSARGYLWHTGDNMELANTTAGAISFNTNSATRGSISSAGVWRLHNLAGTGDRVVVASSNGTLSASTSVTGLVDTTTISTRAWRQKGDDSLGAIIATKGSGTVTSVATGYGLSGGTITTTGTLLVDTLNIATRAWRQKGLDSLAALEVSGSGTTNYLPKFTAASTIGNSQIFDNGTNVGIGITTGMSERFNVANSSGNANASIATSSATSGAFLRFGNATNADGLYVGYNNPAGSLLGNVGGANAGVIMGYGSYPIGFGTNATERVRITSGGNVGINDTNPTDLLVVNGRMRVNGTNRITFGNNSGGYAGIGITGATTGNLTFNTFDGTSDGERLRIFANGRVGVNTTTDAGYQFDINGTLRSVNGANFATTSGNVGIGTASPTSKLDVLDGDISVNTLSTFSFFNTNRNTIPSGAGTSLGGLRYRAYATGTTYQVGAQILSFSSAAWSSTSSPSYLSFQTTPSGSVTPSERMVIDASGNVGIGTTSPAAKLDVTGDIRSTANLRSNNGTVDNVVSFTSEPAGVIGTISNHPETFWTNGSEKMRLSTSGELLINTTTDAGDYKLQVAGNILTNIIYTRNNTDALIFGTNGAVNPYMQGTSGNALAFGTSNNPRILITADGEVLVNTLTDAGDYKLQVSGNALVTAGKLDITTNTAFGLSVSRSGTSVVGGQINNSNGILYYGAESSTGGGLFTGSSAYAAVIGSGANYPLQFATNNVTRATIDNAGALLIGATTAYNVANKMEVYGPMMIRNSPTSGTLNLDSTALSANNITNRTAFQVTSFNLTGSGGNAIFYASGTWNTTAATNAIDVTLTNTASGAGSNYLRITDGVNQFRVTKEAEVVTAAPTGGSIRKWKLGEAATVSPTSPNRTIRVEIDGTVYYLHAKTTND